MSFFKRLQKIGPGAMVAAAFIGPGTVLTATVAGASYGYTLLWAVLFSTIATIILQEMSARLGAVAKMGLGDAIRKKAAGPGLRILSLILVIGAILIGNAAYEAGNISGAALGFNDLKEKLGIPFNPLILIIGIITFGLLYSGKYKLVEKFIIGLVGVMGLVFLITAILIEADWMIAFSSLFKPSIPEGSALKVIGIIGTTVVPYNLFLHASSVNRKWQDTESLSNARWDTILSISFGGIITMAILITTAASFNMGSEINNMNDLSSQLTPILGNWAYYFMSLGFLAAGLSSSITAPLAAAFATSEMFNWSSSMQDKKFRLVWIFVLGIGVLFSLLGFKPTSVILFAQIANGLLLPIIAAFLLWIMNDKSIMGKQKNSLLNNILGCLILLVTIGLGIKGIMAALGLL
ncbi:MAG: Nramp family divalent metal transporter [Bacteroidota bacterium]